MRLWAVALLCAGCISGSIRAGEDLRPPEIRFGEVDPRPGLIVVTDLTTPMRFQVLQFREPNVGDTLFIRWFVDYHRNPAIQKQEMRPPVPGSTTPERRPGSEFVVTQAMLEPNVTTEPHLVEVVVSDRAFDDPGSPTQPNRTFAPDGLGDVVSWTLLVRSAPSAKPAPAPPPPPAWLDGAWRDPEGAWTRTPMERWLPGPPIPEIRWPHPLSGCEEPHER